MWECLPSLPMLNGAAHLIAVEECCRSRLPELPKLPKASRTEPRPDLAAELMSRAHVLLKLAATF